MSTSSEIAALRRELEKLDRRADARLVTRYALWHPPGQRRTLYRRVRKALGVFLRRIGLRQSHPAEPWLPGLKHADNAGATDAAVIWAIGADRDRLRDACAGFHTLFAEMPDRAPVLITDVADFAHYSRLGWLVEYVPTLSGPAVDYRDRKMCYLAWRYRGAPALPYTLGLRKDLRIEDLQID